MKMQSSSIDDQKFRQLIAWLRDPKNKKTIEQCLIDSLNEAQKQSEELRRSQRIS